ncbi:D-alanyl-D-alanine carboxypeptidase family protein [Yinghuangia soli]|uniref:D-alanyl-D-alanine carboxypeptidase family protein n=1 Tax=Yinghuangia soli TaxID=2908204 RepID=A0AA41PUS5_9ACTN|nr:D-alanyl-D-alanine carboxypeptidase family protein [Yinghuangia soli]MCF2526091.1 D-alanyl-D-alanine carboxypeptidase family protein [Yinghuangia soli]
MNPTFVSPGSPEPRPGSGTATGTGRRSARKRVRVPIVMLWVGTVTVSTGIGTALGATVFADMGRGSPDTVTVSNPFAGPRATPSGSGAPGPAPNAAGSKPASGASGSTPSEVTVRCDAGDGADIPDPGATDPDKLAPGARAAYRKAEEAMAAAKITLTLRSGARTYEHQKLLWDTEVACKGSESAARARVLPPGESSHVQGTAIDIAPKAAQTWLERNGSRFGWCRMYDNEPWHFEYSASYTAGCPDRKPHP